MSSKGSISWFPSNTDERLKDTPFKHMCTLLPNVNEEIDGSVLSTESIVLPKSSSQLKRFILIIRKFLVISLRNPRSHHYFRSEDSIQTYRNKLLANKCNVIHPFSMFRLIYEMYMAVLFLVCFVLFPTYAAFLNEQVNPHAKYLNICCVLDIFITFFTGYVKKDNKEVVMNPKQIATYYIFRSTLIIDVVSCILPELISDQSSITFQAFHIFGFLKIFKVNYCYVYFSRSLSFFKINNTISRSILKLIFSLLVIHWWTCVMFLTPHLRYYCTGEYAIETYLHNFFEETTLNSYIKTFHYTSALLLSIRTEPFGPKPWEEYFVSISCRAFGKIFFLFLTVMIVPKFLALMALETKYYEIKKQLKGFMFKKQLPLDLRRKLIKNYEYKYRGNFFQENKITKILSDQLKCDINIEVLSKLCENINLFENLPNKSLQTILSHLKLQIYLPNDLIIKSGVVGDCMYFLASGTVAVLSPSGQEICHLSDGDYFGEISLLLSNKKRTASILALETCEIYKLSKHGFRHSLKLHDKIMGRMREVAKSRMQITDEIENAYLKSQTDLSDTR